MGQKKLFELEAKDFTFVSTQVQGMRVLAKILDYCEINSSSFNPDTAIMAFKEGKRDVGLWILSLIHEQNNGPEMLLNANKYRNQIFMEVEKDGKAS